MPHTKTNGHAPLASASAATVCAGLAALLTCFLMASSALAQTRCSVLADPNSTVGQNCRTPITFNRPQPAELPSLATPPIAPQASGQAVSPWQSPGGRQVPEGQQPGRGQFVCAVLEPGTGRCLTMRPNTKDYDSAVQTGVEAAMMGMQVQADAIRRAQEMGLMPPGMPQPGMAPMGQPPMGMPQWPQQQPMPAHAAPGIGKGPLAGDGAQAYAECVNTTIARFRSATGRHPSPSEEQQILLQCQ